MKRTKIRAVSSKRLKENVERKRRMIEHFGPQDEWKCQLAPNIDTPCFGPIAGHEILKRSRGGSITDMDNIMLACSMHNSWVEDNPDEAHRLGLAKHSWEG